MKWAYYNEIDPFAAQWLKNLISAGHLPDGEVDERSIADIRPDELTGFLQCHFFAGIGGWAYALNLAGWSEDLPVWTGSCPCQPFSVAGKRKGTDDERHLWPDWRWLIDQCRPATIFGEQVASKDGRTWLSGVRSDLEVLGYGVGAADMCAASIGAPHIRQRLWFVADASSTQAQRGESKRLYSGASTSGAMGRVVHTSYKGLERHVGYEPIRNEPGRLTQEQNRPVAPASDSSGLGDPRYMQQAGLIAKLAPGLYAKERKKEQHTPGFAMPSSAWNQIQWLPCADGKARPIKPGIEPLAHGISGRVGRLRAYGNAIVPPLAAEFIGAFMDSEI